MNENLRATIRQVFDDYPIEREFAVDEFIDLLVSAISPDASQPREAVRGSSRQVGVENRHIRMASVKEMMDQGMPPFDEDSFEAAKTALAGGTLTTVAYLLGVDPSEVEKIAGQPAAVGHEPACPWQVGRPEEICTCPPVIEYDSELGGAL